MIIECFAELKNFKLIGPNRTQAKWLRFSWGTNQFQLCQCRGGMIIYELKLKSQSLN